MSDHATIALMQTDAEMRVCKAFFRALLEETLSVRAHFEPEPVDGYYPIVIPRHLWDAYEALLGQGVPRMVTRIAERGYQNLVFYDMALIKGMDV